MTTKTESRMKGILDYQNRMTKDLNSGNITKPDLKLFDTFILPAPSYSNPNGENGYVVIPNDLTTDYLNDFYGQEEILKVTDLVNGLTYGGHVTARCGELSLWRINKKGLNSAELNALNDVEKRLIDRSVRIVGFDNAHLHPNAVDAKTGARKIAKKLKEIYEDGES